MKRLFFVVASVLALSVATPAISTTSPPKALESIRPIMMVDAGDLRNMCSAASINERRRLWLTAAHCVDKENRYIMGDKVEIIEIDTSKDIAVVMTRKASAPALKLARNPTKYLDRIFVLGHPLGFPDATVQAGNIAHPRTRFTDRAPYNRFFTLMAVTGAPGNSGSPVVNSKWEIVSVVQIAWGRSFEPMMGGATWQELFAYRNYFN